MSAKLSTLNLTDSLDGLLSSAQVPPAAAGRPTSPFEFWPGWLFYLPVALQWIWLGLRHGDLTLPTAANPGITAGGLCGESKTAILDRVAGPARGLIAPYVRIVTGTASAADAAVASTAMAAAGVTFPLVAKPDIGCNGTGVQLIVDRPALARYLAAFPRRAAVMLQTLISDPGEAGIFYIRHPDEAHGWITSLTLKTPPMVTGDGRSTLRELISRDRRLGRLTWLFFPRLAGRLNGVPQPGEPVRLTFVGNHCKGSTFHDGRDHVTAALVARIEAVARNLPGFYFGRFDVRFGSLADLRRGIGLRIIEINGIGSEATHIWDPRTTLADAYRTQFAHYRAAFAIARRNREAGHRSTGLRALARLWLRQRRLMASYPPHD